MQVTINSISSPELLRRLQSIQLPKHRVELLRKLAEIGLGVVDTVPSGPDPQVRAPIVRAAPQQAVQPDRFPDSRSRSANGPGRAQLPNASTREQTAPSTPLAPAALPSAGSVESAAGVAPPPFANDLSAAMDRFF